MKCIRVVPNAHILNNKLFVNNVMDNLGHCVVREDVGQILIHCQIRMELNVKRRTYG